MNYELAKELKDAGFPMPLPLPDERLRDAFGEDGQIYAFPTLEELIEACGEGEVVEAIKDGRLTRLTPEAVARLWLALNKK